MANPTNPFVLSGYYGKKYFCNREDETRQLIDNLVNGRSTTLTAIRRIGKTGLIRHAIERLPDDYTGIYIDILPTENMNEFLNRISSVVFATIPEKTSPGKKILDFIKSLRPVISFDPLTGQPQLSFDLKEEESSRHIASILQYLENYPKKIIIAIDEFQQIVKYPDKNADAWLRSIIQGLNNTSFIFSGSQQHLMNELFTNPSKPFFRSTSLLAIGKIDTKSYTSFIKGHFLDSGKQIDDKIIKEMLEWTDRHTYYVQLLCNRVYALKNKSIKSKTWKDEAAKLLQEHEMLFFKYRDLLSKQQWLLLKAIAHEGNVYEPTSKRFISKYNLGSPSTVLRSLEALLHKEMTYIDFDAGGLKYYSVYDVLFKRWMER